MSVRDGGGWLRYGLPGMALGLALAFSAEGRGPAALAQNPGAGSPAAGGERARGVVSAEAGSNGTLAFTTTSAGSGQLLYLIDTKAKSFAVYRVDPANSKGAVKLEAARQYKWDLQLSEYNNQEPNVAAIESTVSHLGTPRR